MLRKMSPLFTPILFLPRNRVDSPVAKAPSLDPGDLAPLPAQSSKFC